MFARRINAFLNALRVSGFGERAVLGRCSVTLEMRCTVNFGMPVVVRFSGSGRDTLDAAFMASFGAMPLGGCAVKTSHAWLGLA